MNDDDILRLGELSHALLVSADFETIVQQYKLTVASDMLATLPDDTKRREQLYHSLYGIEGLTSFMKLQADAAAHIRSPKNPDTEGTTDYHVEPLYDDEGFPRANESDDS